MKREVKFRGLRIDGKGWVYGGYFQHTPDEDGVRYYIFDFNEGAVEVIPESVGQFTGLHDNNGKEVFEGDIFELGVVEWIDGAFRFKNSNCYMVIDSHIAHNFEIMGNVFENADLVKL